MFHYKKIFLIIFLTSLASFSQEKITVSGSVYDENSNETLIGVSIYFPELNSGTTTNEYGFYSITVPKGSYQIQVSYLGFTSIIETIKLSKKLTKNFKLETLPGLLVIPPFN